MPLPEIALKGEQMEKPGTAKIGRPKTLDREGVIEIAMQNYWAEGVDGVSLNEICRRAGVSKPGVYREFGGEDGLTDAVLERYAESVLVPNMAQIAPEQALSETLGSLVELMTDTTRSGPAGCLLAKMQGTPSRIGPLTRSRVEALRKAARSSYADVVARAKGRGELPTDLSTTVAAAFIDIQCTNLLVQMALGEDPELLRAQATLAFAGLVAGDG